jgi:hypothetical protein
VFSDENLQRYTKALYPAAFLLVLVPLVDIALRSMNAEAGSLQWRFGTVGLLFGNLGTVVLGLSLAGLLSAISGNRKLLRAIGLIAIVLAVVLAALLVLFGLDAIQIRRLVAVPMRRGIVISTAGAAFASVMGMIALAVGGRGALVASRADRAASERRTKAASPLVAQTAPRPRAGEPV